MNYTKKVLITIGLSMLLMWAWIILAVFLTDGKEMSDFTAYDYKIILGLIVALLLTLLFMGIRLTKLRKKYQVDIQEKVAKTRYEKIICRRGYFLEILAFLFALISMVLGIKTLSGSVIVETWFFNLVLALCCVIPILFYPANVILRKRHAQALKRMNVEEMQKFIVEHRNLAEQISKEKLSFLRICRHLTVGYSVVLAIFAFFIAFLAGARFDVDFAMWFYFLSSFLFMCALSRVHFPVPEALFEEDPTYVSAGEYPELYSLVQKAAAEIGCKGTIWMAILADFNAGIAKVGDSYSIQIGVSLLNVLSREEIYSILLHEFAHMVVADARAEKEYMHHYWLSEGGNRLFLSTWLDSFFGYSNDIYLFHYLLYQYACSVLNETSADQKMAEYGDPAYAASALLKLKYYELFTWEKGTSDGELSFQVDEPSRKTVEDEVERFKNEIPKRKVFWNQMIEDEILSRSATHPTLKMRLETLGVTSYQVKESEDSEAYRLECKKALHYIDHLFYEKSASDYDELRRVLYVEPLQRIAEWEASGKPVIAEEYADIDQALRRLGRVSEANRLCNQAISELDQAASCYAYFMKGCFLLHSYDASGIQFIYHAMEHNNNYVNEGLSAIGEFCCLMGRQDELEIYRKKALEFSQKQVDFYNEITVLRKNDTITEEKLPGTMLQDMLAYVQTIDEGIIQNIYLIRKIVSEEFFSSVFVIRFEEQADTKARDRVLHKIFSYLDTCSDWQFSLFTYEEAKEIKVDSIPNSCVYIK